MKSESDRYVFRKKTEVAWEKINDREMGYVCCIGITNSNKATSDTLRGTTHTWRCTYIYRYVNVRTIGVMSNVLVLFTTCLFFFFGFLYIKDFPKGTITSLIFTIVSSVLWHFSFSSVLSSNLYLIITYISFIN